jgi:hypothetical protein
LTVIEVPLEGELCTSGNLVNSRGTENCRIRNPLPEVKSAFGKSIVNQRRFPPGIMDYCDTRLVARTATAEAATATAAATTATKPAATTAATTAAEAPASILTRLSFVNGQTATVEFRAIESGDGGLTF